MAKREQTDARRKAVKKYHSEKIEQIVYYVPKGKKAIIQAFAASRNLSVNHMIDNAVDEYMGKSPEAPRSDTGSVSGTGQTSDD